MKYFSKIAPSSPSNQRKFLHATRTLKTGSVDLPDEKSHSSESTSPCPSPVRLQVKLNYKYHSYYFL